VLWRRPVGPGWSSFAAHGDRFYTQEQRGPDEVVACYELATGQPVWAHRDATRFWESNGGPGLRGTPTLSNGQVYTFGATGILNVLKASDGTVMWSRSPASDAGVKTPGWGFASSPLVVRDMVIAAAAGKLAAYNLGTGTPRWFGPDGGDGYSSPQLVTIEGVTQIVLMSAAGATSVAPADGKVLWKYAWPSDTRIMQPAVTADGDLLITAGDAMGGVGMRRIAVTHGPTGWTAEERWTLAGLKPSFNDSVVHDGHAFGFDGSILACIDLKDGKRTWKGGRYGNGQFLLLADQDLLLVVSEEGDLALVKATPRSVHGARSGPGYRGQDLGPPGVGWRRPAGSEWRGDGCISPDPRGQLRGCRIGDDHSLERGTASGSACLQLKKRVPRAHSILPRAGPHCPQVTRIENNRYSLWGSRGEVCTTTLKPVLQAVVWHRLFSILG
jgi:outer membrane protein assembly factor BamB